MCIFNVDIKKFIDLYDVNLNLLKNNINYLVSDEILKGNKPIAFYKCNKNCLSGNDIDECLKSCNTPENSDLNLINMFLSNTGNINEIYYDLAGNFKNFKEKEIFFYNFEDKLYIDGLNEKSEISNKNIINENKFIFRKFIKWVNEELYFFAEFFREIIIKVKNNKNISKIEIYRCERPDFILVINDEVYGVELTALMHAEDSISQNIIPSLWNKKKKQLSLDIERKERYLKHIKWNNHSKEQILFNEEMLKSLKCEYDGKLLQNCITVRVDNYKPAINIASLVQHFKNKDKYEENVISHSKFKNLNFKSCLYVVVLYKNLRMLDSLEFSDMIKIVSKQYNVNSENIYVKSTKSGWNNL